MPADDLCGTCKGLGYLSLQTALFPGEPDEAPCPDCDERNRRIVFAPDTENPWEPIPVPGAPIHACAGMLCQVCQQQAGSEADAAILRVDLAADDEWKRVATFIVISWAREGREFTTDEVMLAIEQTGVSTRDNRALGAVIRKALTAGQICEIGMTRSRRRHGARIPIYRGVLRRTA